MAKKKRKYRSSRKGGGAIKEKETMIRYQLGTEGPVRQDNDHIKRNNISSLVIKKKHGI